LIPVNNYTSDDWKACRDFIQPKKHLIGIQHTISIEGFNSNFRLFLKRINRRTKCNSMTQELLDNYLKLMKLDLIISMLYKQYQYNLSKDISNNSYYNQTFILYISIFYSSSAFQISKRILSAIKKNLHCLMIFQIIFNRIFNKYQLTNNSRIFMFR
jgi:hypothetical protein